MGVPEEPHLGRGIPVSVPSPSALLMPLSSLLPVPPCVCAQDYGGNLIMEVDMVEVDEMEVHGLLSSGANPNIGDPEVGYLINLEVDIDRYIEWVWERQVYRYLSEPQSHHQGCLENVSM